MAKQMRKVDGGCKTYQNAEYYKNLLKNNKNLKTETNSYKNGDIWTGYTDKDGVHKGSISKCGKDIHIRIGNETFVDVDGDGTIDRSFKKNKNKNTWVEYSAYKPDCLHNKGKYNLDKSIFN